MDKIRHNLSITKHVKGGPFVWFMECTVSVFVLLVGFLLAFESLDSDAALDHYVNEYCTETRRMR